MFSPHPRRTISAFVFALPFLPCLLGGTSYCAPATPPFLPFSRSVQGLQVKITQAGFGSPVTVIKEEAAKTKPQSGFYFSYSASLLGAQLTPDQLKEVVSLNGLFAPDGAPLRTSSNWGQTSFYEDVEPNWKSVRAEFEVRVSGTSQGDTGREQTPEEIKDVALPEIGETISPEKAQFVTERGTRVRLAKLTRSPLILADSTAPPGASVIKAVFEVEPPQDTPEAEISVEKVRTFYGDQIDGGYDKRVQGGFEIESLNVPKGAKTASYSFDLVEMARRWRKAEAFKRVSIDIPVAAVWKKSPLQPHVPFVPSVTAKNADFEARWDGGYDLLGRISESYTFLNSRLWMRDLHPNPALGSWTPKKVQVVEGDKMYDVFSWGAAPEGVFHADGMLKSPGEVGYQLQYSTYNRPEPYVDLKVTAQRARTYISTHALQDVPLPTRNQMREYKANEFFDGTWHLRRAIWVDDAKLKDKIEFSNGAGLLLIFERDPKTYFPEDGMMIVGDIFYDEKGVVDPSQSTFQDGDPLLKGHEKDRVTMILSAPKPGTTHFGGNFRVRQQVWAGEEKELTLPHVGLEVRPGVPSTP